MLLEVEDQAATDLLEGKTGSVDVLRGQPTRTSDDLRHAWLRLDRLGCRHNPSRELTETGDAVIRQALLDL